MFIMVYKNVNKCFEMAGTILKWQQPTLVLTLLGLTIRLTIETKLTELIQRAIYNR